MTLTCLSKISEAIPLEVIVVDNASRIDELEYVKANFPNVIFIENKKNLGFSKANNIGVQSANSENILILNPDTIISQSVIEKSIRLLHSREDIGAVAVKMLDGNGDFLPESVRSFPNIKSSLFKLVGLKRFSTYYKGLKDDGRIEAMAGACMFFKKEIFLNIGGFDERYFMYGEDIDISYQLNQSGYAAQYINDSEIIHFKGKSSVKSNWKYQNSFYSAMKLYWSKNFNQQHNKLMDWLMSIIIGFLKVFSFLTHTIRVFSFPILDFVGILATASGFSYLWAMFIKNDSSFLPEKFYLFILPLYALSSIFSFFINKFYTFDIDFSKLFRAMFLNFILFLLIYFMLPSDYKYSRAVIVYCSLISFIVPSGIRYIYSRIYRIKLAFSNTRFMVGHIIPNSLNADTLRAFIERYSRYRLWINTLNFTDKILDIEQLTNETIIDEIKFNHNKKTLWLYSRNGNYLIQSHGKNSNGYIIAPDTNIAIDEGANRFLKRAIDIFLSLAMIPLCFFTIHQAFFVLKSAWNVFLGNNTWIYPKGIKNEYPIFSLNAELSEDYLRNYNLRMDLYYFIRSMFIS